MESFVIKGGQPLSGTIRPAGNKNAALPIVAASLLADEPVVLRNVPHILDVETMLELVASTGATVERTGPNEVRIDPRGLRRASLDPALCTRIRASVLLAAPLVARTGHCLLPPPGGDVIGRRRLDTHLLAFRSLEVGFSRLGLTWELDADRLRVPRDQPLEVEDDLGQAIPKIDDGPWPAFPADLTSIAVAVATQARGTVLIFEKMFENRLVFVDKLVGMGARIIVCDPHRVVVNGPTQLYGERLESPDIRAGMALLLAALAADGESIIGNVGQIDRGYERIDERLRALGANIDRTG